MYRPFWTTVHCRWGTSYTCPTDRQTSETLDFDPRSVHRYFSSNQRPQQVSLSPYSHSTPCNRSTLPGTHSCGSFSRACYPTGSTRTVTSASRRARRTAPLWEGMSRLRAARRQPALARVPGRVHLVGAIRQWYIIRVTRALGISLRCYKRPLGLLSLIKVRGFLP